MIFPRTKRAFEVKLKTFFLVWQVLLLRVKKQTSTNVADTTFKSPGPDNHQVPFKAQLELETDLKKRKTRLFLALLNWLAWHFLFLLFYLFSKSPDTIKHPPNSFYFYEVLSNIIFKRLLSKGVIFRQSSTNCLVRFILNPSKITARAVSIFFDFFNCSSTDLHFHNCTVTSISHLPRLHWVLKMLFFFSQQLLITAFNNMF